MAHQSNIDKCRYGYNKKNNTDIIPILQINELILIYKYYCTAAFWFLYLRTYNLCLNLYYFHFRRVRFE